MSLRNVWCNLRHHRITKMLGKAVPAEMPETLVVTTALWQSFLEARKNILGKKLLIFVK